MSFIQYFRALALRPHLIASMVCGILVYFLLPESITTLGTTKIILAWDIGISIYLALAFGLMYQSNHTRIADRALQQVEGQGFILALSIIATLMSLFSIVMHLSTIKELHGTIKVEYAALVITTILLSWCFIHVIFSLHYAHTYYERVVLGKPGGLIFPGPDMPDYLDFLYFALIIGTSGQTADVSFACRKLRRTGTFHCVLAYLFNTSILALTINIASGLA